LSGKSADSDFKAGSSPRVLFGDDHPRAGPVKATLPGGPAILFGEPKAPPPKGTVPRIIGVGELRRRLPCSKADLTAIDPSATQPVVSRALAAVQAINLDDHHFDDVLRFGAALQAEHGRLAERELALVGDAVLAQANGLTAELISHLEALDPEQVFLADEGLVAKLRFFSSGHDPEKRFTQLYPLVRSLAQDLQALAPAIGAVADRLRAISARYRALDCDLSAHILAGRFLVSHVGALELPDRERQAHFVAQAEAIETRLASLLATAASIAVGRRTLETTARIVDGLSWSSEALLREELPAWHTAYSAALAAARSSNAGNASLSVLRGMHLRILEKLRWKG